MEKINTYRCSSNGYLCDSVSSYWGGKNSLRITLPDGENVDKVCVLTLGHDILDARVSKLDMLSSTVQF